MEQRKLIKLGNSSFTIALPKNWVKKSGLKKGDNVFVIPNSKGELVIQSSFSKISEEKKIEINVENKDSFTLKRELRASYINGYNVFCIRGKRNRDIASLIKKTIGELIGMEIIKNESEEIIAKDLLNMDEMDINNCIRRIDNNLREMFDIMAEGFKKQKLSQTLFSDIVSADKDITKFHLLISRILSLGIDTPAILTKLKVTGVLLINTWWFSVNLEHIGDNIKSVARIIKLESLEKKDNEKLFKLFIRLRDLYCNSLESFYNDEFTKEKILNLANEGKELWEEFDKLTLNKNSTIAKIAMKLKEAETFIYQNMKMVLNNKDLKKV